MSTTASVAQFMAILSGGVNPALLRQGGTLGVSVNTDTKANKPSEAIDFKNFLNSQNPANTGLNLGLSSDILEKISAGSLTLEDALMANLPQGVIDKLTTLTTANANLGNNEKLEASPIWQFIRQQANTETNSGNLLVISLSEKGLPQDVIDGLQSLFGEGDLITILKDPKLNAQLDNALSDITVDLQDIQTAQIAPVIDAILTQNKGKIGNSIQFNVDEAELTKEGIQQLLDNADNYLLQESGFKFVPTLPNPTLVPVQQTLVQFQSGDIGDEIALQTLTSVQPSKNSGKLTPATNPFTKALDETSDIPLATVPHANQSEARASLQNNTPVNLSTAKAAENAQNKNIAGADYSAGALSSEIFSLSGDGKYAIPFEASFKTASQAANPLIATPQSSQAHPATQSLALSMTKMAGLKTDENGDSSQKYRLQLDPPEMGRLDIEMDIIGGHTKKIKAVISVERPETYGLMQRDLHALVKAMQNVGFENISQSDISFTLSDNNNALSDHAKDNGHGGRNSEKNANSAEGIESASELNTQMTIIIDPITGQKQVNMLV